VTRYTEGFGYFVTSIAAPVASGWSDRRVGLAPTGKRRLTTAHTRSGHFATARCAVRGWAVNRLDLSVEPLDRGSAERDACEQCQCQFELRVHGCPHGGARVL
jgi:hypothetical protein